MSNSTTFECVIFGESTLPVHCGNALLNRGHKVVGVITSDAGLQAWAAERQIPHVTPDADLIAFVDVRPFDYLLSIVNGHIVPDAVLARARRGGINFHDGPLPRYAGYNVTSWAILNGERQHGITWHMMERELDAGDIVRQELFEIAPEETSFTLNAKCYEVAIRTFGEMIDDLSAGMSRGIPQDKSLRSYIPRWNRPADGCLLPLDGSASRLQALARTLEFGPYPNPFGVAKIFAGGRYCAIGAVEVQTGTPSLPLGGIVAVDRDSIQVALADGVATLRKLSELEGEPVAADSLGLRVGAQLEGPASEVRQMASEIHARISRHETFWTKRLGSLASICLADDAVTGEMGSVDLAIPAGACLTEEQLIAAFGVYLGRLKGETFFDIGYTDAEVHTAAAGTGSLTSPSAPLRFQIDDSRSFSKLVEDVTQELIRIRKAKTWMRDLPQRYPELRGKPELRKPHLFSAGVSAGTEHLAARDLTLRIVDGVCSLVYNSGLYDQAAATALANQFTRLVLSAGRAGQEPLYLLSLLGEEERRTLLQGWNSTAIPFEETVCIHEFFEKQAAKRPNAAALVFEDKQLTYEELNHRANKLAAYLRTQGVGPEVTVGLSVERSLEMVVGLLGILKAGGAYVPIDPSYPSDRIELVIQDAQLRLLLTQEKLRQRYPDGKVNCFCLDSDWPKVEEMSSANAPSGAGPGNLAYLIYTSGSTGKPKGVMITHRNVSNFFTGMDKEIGGNEPGVWLAVTSISFDISVLELFWTLARGFKVVLLGDQHRATISEADSHSGKELTFSLFYFQANDMGRESDKFRLLLEGAKFGDKHGFEAVWTPERHFHSFGGLYPNPAVAQAAVAACTSGIKLRAGSVVVPLHHPARVAEEWSMVDNLSGGRVGISFASGWHARDFLLAPQNFANNKAVMFESIEAVRRLWRGEKLTFKDGKGEDATVGILPLPVQSELPVWVTAAGNPETFRMAGERGYNILTHLLGQKFEEVADKIAVYRKARKDAGFEPETGRVTLMLHTFVGPTRDQVREKVRGPFIEYLKSSLDLIKKSPWSFPAFKKGQSVQDLDLSSLPKEDMDALLEMAFERYFDTSGFFGTVDECLALTSQIEKIDVDEVACLIDFGIGVDDVLGGLQYLNQVKERYQGARKASYSLPDQVRRHAVTHLQCTPSMAKMLLLAPQSRLALSGLKKLLVGGEALPGALKSELESVVTGEILNMYGPTETTIWSTTSRLKDDEGVTIGRPIANTQLYVLDSRLQPAPIGVPGELFIAGDGVARGYFHRPELTDERFVPNPFSPDSNARMYRTGDLVRYLPDGRLVFLGRLDHQVKIRGFRIELGEIETALAKHTGVRDAVVVAREDRPGEPALVAYYVAMPSTGLTERELRDHLSAQLPEYMIPSAFVGIEALPLTPNGKIDRKALPKPHSAEMVNDAAPYQPPSSGLEETIAGIWSDALSRPRIGVQDNFFDLGAHSIIVMQVNGKLREALNRDISLIDLFRFPTVRSLAKHLSTADSDAADSQGADRARMRQRMMGQRRNLRRADVTVN